VNLFCSGHCFLPDGKLLIVGGHDRDGVGIEQACTYDFQTNQFKASTPMDKGRWYPSALPLPDGRVLVLSGSKTGFTATEINNIPEIWSPDISTPNKWTEVTEPFPEHKIIFPLYPRVHLNAEGRIFMVGPLAETWVLQFPKDKDGNDIKTPVRIGTETHSFVGKWAPAGLARAAGFRDYAPSVMYDSGKVIYIGGGSKIESEEPTRMAEFIDLNSTSPTWTMTNPMNFARKQFNATVLPDGTVLVTGGTRRHPRWRIQQFFSTQPRARS
jgi:galactose oxidase